MQNVVERSTCSACGSYRPTTEYHAGNASAVASKRASGVSVKHPWRTAGIVCVKSRRSPGCKVSSYTPTSRGGAPSSSVRRRVTRPVTERAVVLRTATPTATAASAPVS